MVYTDVGEFAQDIQQLQNYANSPTPSEIYDNHAGVASPVGVGSSRDSMYPVPPQPYMDQSQVATPNYLSGTNSPRIEDRTVRSGRITNSIRRRDPLGPNPNGGIRKVSPAISSLASTPAGSSSDIRPAARTRNKSGNKQKPTTKKDEELKGQVTHGLTEFLNPYPEELEMEIKRFIGRSAEKRLAERAQSKDGRIKRPMNAFMLYRKAFQNRIKSWIGSENHQYVSKIAGFGWQLEPEDTKAKYNKWANLEAEGHQKAFPDYRFNPTRVPGKKSGDVKPSCSDDEGYHDDNGNRQRSQYHQRPRRQPNQYYQGQHQHPNQTTGSGCFYRTERPGTADYTSCDKPGYYNWATNYDLETLNHHTGDASFQLPERDSRHDKVMSFQFSNLSRSTTPGYPSAMLADEAAYQQPNHPPFSGAPQNPYGMALYDQPGPMYFDQISTPEFAGTPYYPSPTLTSHPGYHNADGHSSASPLPAPLPDGLEVMGSPYNPAGVGPSGSGHGYFAPHHADTIVFGRGDDGGSGSGGIADFECAQDQLEDNVIGNNLTSAAAAVGTQHYPTSADIESLGTTMALPSFDFDEAAGLLDPVLDPALELLSGPQGSEGDGDAWEGLTLTPSDLEPSK
ncbi:hypothetical protein BX600DRAFT_534813 [Xylariales sp. PMI_506]|nr:hypothetical protein BX600DRAFT_534813 [Xylariales sp. PMI_506]